ncbi:MAG: response regulator [Rhodospirillaceae bacterium]|nr:response regulator [Rhodospirillaceae bacterium]
MPAERDISVLVVDDYTTMLRAMTSVLERLAFTDIDQAEDARAALHLLSEKTYGLIISDWDMQPMTGLELLQAVRADARFRTTPFILATAENNAERMAVARAAGASGCIAKPFTAADLKRQIDHALGAG